MRLLSLVAIAACVSASFTARADTFNFTFGNPSNTFSGFGVLTTGTAEAPGEFLISSVTGTAETVSHGPNLAITSILPPGTFPTITNGGSFPANDNTLFVTNGTGSLDGNGLSFILSDGSQINLYNPEGSAADALLQQANGAEFTENVPVAITAVAQTKKT